MLRSLHMEKEQLTPSFGVGEIVREGWAMTKVSWKEYLRLFVLGFLATFPLQAVRAGIEFQSIFQQAFMSEAPSRLAPVGSLLGILAGLVQLIFTIATIKLALATADKRSVPWKQLFAFSWGTYGKILLAMALFCAMVGLGLLALIVPGIIIAIGFGLYGMLIIDENTKIGESFEKSWKLTKGNKAKLFSMGAIVLLAMMASLVIPTIPVIIVLITKANVWVTAIVTSLAVLFMLVASFVLTTLSQNMSAAAFRRMQKTR